MRTRINLKAIFFLLGFIKSTSILEGVDKQYSCLKKDFITIHVLLSLAVKKCYNTQLTFNIVKTFLFEQCKKEK